MASVMRLFLVDTLTTIVFFTTVAGLTEFFIAGLGPREVLITRLTMIPIMILTARPYGAWRDLLFRRLRPLSQPTRAVVDVAAFLSFQVPVYGATLLLAGASVPQALTAIGAALVFMILLSRPFGLVLDAMRRLARVT